MKSTVQTVELLRDPVLRRRMVEDNFQIGAITSDEVISPKLEALLAGDADSPDVLRTPNVEKPQ